MRCPACHVPISSCFCRDVVRSVCGVRVVVIRHASERKRISGSGRLIAAAIEGGTVIDYGAPDTSFDLAPALSEPAWLLFPDPAHPSPPSVRPRTLIVLDGTWPQARRMRQRIAELRGRPIMNLRGAAGPYLRAQRKPSELPTALAVADALEQLGEVQGAEALRHAFDRLTVTMRKLGRQSGSVTENANQNVDPQAAENE